MDALNQRLPGVAATCRGGVEGQLFGQPQGGALGGCRGQRGDCCGQQNSSKTPWRFGPIFRATGNRGRGVAGLGHAPRRLAIYVPQPRSLIHSPIVGRFYRSASTPKGTGPTGMVSTTVLLSVSITDTVLLKALVT